MNMANYAIQYNPIDLLENIFSKYSYELERRGNNEIAVEIQSKENKLLIFLSWEENIRCLHLSCLIDLPKNSCKIGKIFELLALINEDLWLGHFAYWKEQKMPIFKHSMLIDNEDDISTDKLSQMIGIAINECERMYPIFTEVLVNNIEPEQAVYPMSMHTIGNA